MQFLFLTDATFTSGEILHVDGGARTRVNGDRGHGEKRMTTYQEIDAAARSTQDDSKVRYTAKTHTSGGRRGGVSRSDDGRLDVKFFGPRCSRNRY